MLPIFRQPLTLPARARAMPDLFDRTRIALVAVLASFAALGLALVVHLAATGAPLPLSGIFSEGQVITTGDGTPGGRGGTADRAPLSTASPAGEAPAAIPAESTDGGGDRGRDGRPGAQNGGPEPRQVDISIGSQAPAPPAPPPQVPAATTTPGTGNPATGTSGTGSAGEDTGSTPGGSSGADDNYGHAPLAPTPPSGRGGSKKSTTTSATPSSTSSSTSKKTVSTQATSSSHTSSQKSYKGKSWSKTSSAYGTAADGTTSTKPSSYGVGGSSGSLKSLVPSKRSR